MFDVLNSVFVQRVRFDFCICCELFRLNYFWIFISLLTATVAIFRQKICSMRRNVSYHDDDMASRIGGRQVHSHYEYSMVGQNSQINSSAINKNLIEMLSNYAPFS